MSADEPAIDYEDASCRIGRWRSVVMSCWVEPPTSEQMQRMRATLDRAMARPDPIAFVILVRSGDRLALTDAARSDLGSTFRSSSSRRGPTAVIIEASGFRAAFVRSLMSGIFLVTRAGARKNRIFGARAEGLAWVRGEIDGLDGIDAALETIARGF